MMSTLIELRRALGLTQHGDEGRITRVLDALRRIDPSLPHSPIVVAEVLLQLAGGAEIEAAAGRVIERLKEIEREAESRMLDQADAYARTRADHHFERLLRESRKTMDRIGDSACEAIENASRGADPTRVAEGHADQWTWAGVMLGVGLALGCLLPEQWRLMLSAGHIAAAVFGVGAATLVRRVARHIAYR